MEPIRAEVGERYEIRPPGMENSKHPFTVITVAEPCKENNGYWHCMTHQEGFKNNLQKDIHLDQQKSKKEPCKLAWVCWQHGFEKP